MAVTTRSAAQHPVLPSGRLLEPLRLRLAAPSIFAALSGIAFVILRPGVNDLWAARARASAVEHGVGLTYWFSWFGGGATPGNYSVLSPYTSALIGTEVLGALSALGVTVLATIAARGTVYPVAGAWVAAVAAALNLWSGRVPFLFGSAFAVGAVIAIQHQRRLPAVGLTLVSILASPVSGAFICMGLSGTFLTTRTKAYRPIIAWVMGTVVSSLVAVALVFGAPGPEPFSDGLLFEVVLGQLWLWWAWPPDHIRTTLGASLLATFVLWAIPNGMGSNFSRFLFFCLPVAVVATSQRRWRLSLFAVTPVLIMGLGAPTPDVLNGGNPVSSVGYSTAL